MLFACNHKIVHRTGYRDIDGERYRFNLCDACLLKIIKLADDLSKSPTIRNAV